MEGGAVLLSELDKNEEGGSSSASDGKVRGCHKACGRYCYLLWCDIGILSLMVTVVMTVVGVILLVLVRYLNLPYWVDQLSRYIISSGLFGLATGGTNAIAVLMLLYRIPFVCGSG